MPPEIKKPLDELVCFLKDADPPSFRVFPVLRRLQEKIAELQSVEWTDELSDAASLVGVNRNAAFAQRALEFAARVAKGDFQPGKDGQKLSLPEGVKRIEIEEQMYDPSLEKMFGRAHEKVALEHSAAQVQERTDGQHKSADTIEEILEKTPIEEMTVNGRHIIMRRIRKIAREVQDTRSLTHAETAVAPGLLNKRTTVRLILTATQNPRVQLGLNELKFAAGIEGTDTILASGSPAARRLWLKQTSCMMRLVNHLVGSEPATMWDGSGGRRLRPRAAVRAELLAEDPACLPGSRERRRSVPGGAPPSSRRSSASPRPVRRRA